LSYKKAKHILPAELLELRQEMLMVSIFIYREDQNIKSTRVPVLHVM